MKKLLILFLCVSSCVVNAMQEESQTLNPQLQALFNAVRESNKEKVQKLIVAGINLNERKEGVSILSFAILGGHRAMCKLLLENGATDLGLRNDTPEMHLALGVMILRMMSPKAEEWERCMYNIWYELYSVSPMGSKPMTEVRNWIMAGSRSHL